MSQYRRYDVLKNSYQPRQSDKSMKKTLLISFKTTVRQISIMIPLTTSHLMILKQVEGTQNMNKMMKVLKQSKKAAAKRRKAKTKKENKSLQKILNRARDIMQASIYREKSTKVEKNHLESVFKTQSQKRMKMTLKIDKLKQKVRRPLPDDLKSRNTNVLIVERGIELKKNLIKFQKNNWQQTLMKLLRQTAQTN